jgi:hypothetical protein
VARAWLTHEFVQMTFLDQRVSIGSRPGAPVRYHHGARGRAPSMLASAVTSDRGQYGYRRDGFIVDDNLSAHAQACMLPAAIATSTRYRARGFVQVSFSRRGPATATGSSGAGSTHADSEPNLLCDIDSDVIPMAVVGSLTKYVWALPSAERRAPSRVREDLCP